MDEQFVRRSYRSSAVVWAVAVVLALVFRRPWIALSMTFGMALAVAVLATYDVAVRRIAVPGARKPGRSLLKLMLVKYILIAAALYFIVSWDRISLPAFCGGIALMHLAVVAEALRAHVRGGRDSAAVDLPASPLGDS